jgi:hypothetical protein
MLVCSLLVGCNRAVPAADESALCLNCVDL